MSNQNDGGCGSDGCGCGGTAQPTKEQAQAVVKEVQLRENMDKIKHKLLVLSGKGGVGKSTVAVNLAQALANRGKKVGLLDIDVHGPSIPTMLGLEGQKLSGTEEHGMEPILHEGVKVMSLGFLIPDTDSPVIWRGPLKMGAIEQFLRDVYWGELDYLIVDAPPGTGDEPLSIAQLLPESTALIVTTPQRVATVDVRKSINFCKQLNIKMMGVVENMNGLICPKCGEHIKVFPEGEATKMTDEMGVEFLVSLPLDPLVPAGADIGQPVADYAKTPMGQAMQPLVDKVVAKFE